MLLGLALTSTLTCLTSGSPLEGGLHERLTTANGPVHLWCPTEKPETIVVYVHGYFDDVDDAFRDHGLVEQFKRSGTRAVFVMIDAPKGPKEPVRWTSFAALRAELERHVEGALPTTAVVMGHSGGNRTLRQWARAGEVKDVVLLDAFYGDAAPWDEFLRTVPEGRVQLVGALTFAKADAWRRRLPVEQRSRVEQFEAKTNHMGVITDGAWIPRLLASRASGT